MSSIDKVFYSQFAPVLTESGWWETGAMGYGSVFFRNTIYQNPGIEITVGIVIYPGNWYYCANYSTLGFNSGINVPPPPVTTPWHEVRDYYLTHGLIAYGAYKKDLDAKIEAHNTTVALLKSDIPDLSFTTQESRDLRLAMREASRINKKEGNS